MPSKGQILTNPESGDVYEFIETAKDTNGERVTMKMTLKSTGKLVPDHLHSLQDEHFEVISGNLKVNPWQLRNRKQRNIVLYKPRNPR